MVRHERNIRCSVCGKTYFDPIAAQKVRTRYYCLFSRGAVSNSSQHARKHPAPVVPQLPGNVGVQRTTGMSMNVGDTRTLYTSLPPQRAQPNPAVHVRPSTTTTVVGNPHVAARPSRTQEQPAAVQKVRFSFSRRIHVAALMSRFYQKKWTLHCSLCPHRPNFRSGWHLNTVPRLVTLRSMTN